MRSLVVTAVRREAEAIASLPGVTVMAGGMGRTNAAAATTEAILRNGPFDAVISAGVAGALPGGGLDIGDVVAASACVYVEEGVVTPDGFRGIEAMGFSLGDFGGNTVPVDAALRDALGASFRIGVIATVATCSGTDEAAAMVADRTGAIAEAMEGAAVVHAARRLAVPAIELRVVSNTTGDRAKQVWDLPAALRTLGAAVAQAVELLARR